MDYIPFKADDKTICAVEEAIKIVGQAGKRVLEYSPLDFVSQSATKGDSQETGFWEKEQGISAFVIERNQIPGHIEYFPTIPYLDELELSYHIYLGERRGDRDRPRSWNVRGERCDVRIHSTIRPDWGTLP